MPHATSPSAAFPVEPVLFRVAGLPLDTVERLGSGLCAEVQACAELQTELDGARAALVDLLHQAVPCADPALRRFLLAVKRDCHNGRPVHPRTDDPRWAALRACVGEAADQVAELDRRAAERGAAFQAAFDAVRERQRRVVLESLHDAEFLRAVALGSPDLYDAVRALRGVDPAAFGRRERKAEASLLRYVTRAATKVSPFSTFTPVGIGALAGDAAAVRLRGAPWRSRSLVRVKRYLLHRVSELLAAYGPFRDELRVEMNGSLSETEPGRFTYLRPHRWELDAQGTSFAYQRDALAAVALGGPLLERLAALLSADRPTLRELVQRLEEEGFGCGPDGARARVERLAKAGVLQLMMPWPVHEAHLEKRMLGHLRTLPAEGPHAALVACLERLVALQDGYLHAADCAASVREMRRLAGELGRIAAPLAGVDPAAVGTPRGPAFLYEDVFVSPAGEGAGAPVADVPRAAMREALRSASALVRLSVLFDHRHDFLHTLAAVGRERWGGAEGVGVLQALREVQPLWQAYMKVHLAHWRDAGRGVATWNPRALPELDALHRTRQEVSVALETCGEVRGGERHVDPAWLDALLDRVPAPFADDAAWGAMLLLQPAAADGSRWIVNRLREGTGRYGSRFTAAMDDATREAYAAHLAARSALALDGEAAELLDVCSVHGDTLNVHHPQTARLLTLPADDAAVAAHRRVRLGELRIVLDGPGGLPRLRGAAGERFLPVNLGLGFEAYLPTLCKFLCLFGPSELSTVFPPRVRRAHGPLSVIDRLVVGNLVLHRRAWDVPAAALREALGEADDARAFAAVNRFRARWGIPERVFFADLLPHPFFGTMQKPQYLDFTSPLLVPLLRGALEHGRDDLRLTEMLPDPAMCPRDGAGRGWAVEVLLDSIALRRPHARAAVPPVRAHSGRRRPAPSTSGQLITP